MAIKIQPRNQRATSRRPAWCLRPPPSKDSSPRTKPSSNNKKKKKKNQSPEYTTTEPSSPRIGCLGQVRRRKPPSNEAAGSSHFSSSSSSSDSIPSSNFTRQFSLLLMKRVISSKILLKEMDPPRPVEKKEVREEISVSLWKRRCRRGDSLKLQVQPEES